MVKQDSPWWANETRDAMKGYGLAVCIVLWGLAFLWYYGGEWVAAKAEAEKTQAKTTADLSATMLLLSQAQARSEKRIDEEKARTESFRSQVSREHTEAAKALQDLLTILTDLVRTLKNDRTSTSESTSSG